MDLWTEYQCHQFLQQLQRLEHNMARPVPNQGARARSTVFHRLEKKISRKEEKKKLMPASEGVTMTPRVAHTERLPSRPETALRNSLSSFTTSQEEF